MFQSFFAQHNQAAEEEDVLSPAPSFRHIPSGADSTSDFGGNDYLSSRIKELEDRLKETEDELEYYYAWYKKNKVLVDRIRAEQPSDGGAAAAAKQQQPSGYGDAARRGRGSGSGSSDPIDDDGDGDEELEQRDAEEPWSRTLGRNTALEYTKDSPMFRCQLRAFVETLAPLKAHVEGLLRLTNEYCKSGQKLRGCGVALAEGLCAKEASRTLFTNAYPDMGILAQNLFAFSGTFKQVQELLNIYMCTLESGLAGPLQSFLEGFRDLAELSKGLTERREAYEAQLGRCLDARELPTEGKLFQSVMDARRDYELYRFDVVKYLNQCDASKKVFCLETGINNAYYAMLAFFQGGLDSVKDHEGHMRRRQARLEAVKKQYSEDNFVWDRVRARLEAELLGALPPPGAPLGALAPIALRASCPPYVAPITTEVLSRHSQSASAKDLEHARDEGALVKQGWLSRRKFPGRRERRWYRLHGGRLYVMSDEKSDGDGDGGSGGGSGNLEPTCVLDLKEVTMVTSKPGRFPHSFIAVREDGHSLELQAEGADEMVRWMSALRRGLHAAGGGRDAPPQRQITGYQPEALLRRLEEQNPHCGECCDTDAPIEWVSTNIGVTLCASCAAVHRTLGVNVSALRSLKLDKWSVFVLRAIVECLGNDRAATIWEANVSAGWSKPAPASDTAASDREHFILAKYRWFGFVEESPVAVEEASRRLLAAAATGDTAKVIWCLAHKGDINYKGEGGRSPLHAAVAADHILMATVLLLNGANMYQADDAGGMPAELVAASPQADMAQLLWEFERGELW